MGSIDASSGSWWLRKLLLLHMVQSNACDCILHDHPSQFVLYWHSCAAAISVSFGLSIKEPIQA